MKENNITAKICCFIRGYHYKNNKYKIFNDYIAEKILSDDEYNAIANYMSNGINFFNKNFKGTKEDALRWIVNNRLAPSVLGRSAFCEKALENAINLGCSEYLIFASGYDTFAYRNNVSNLNVYEIDKKEMIEDKIKRLNNSKINIKNVNYISCNFTDTDWINNIINSSYNKEEISLCSLLGISYYLTKEEFFNMLNSISSIIKIGSSIVFDYPTTTESIETRTTEQLASSANEEMKSKYTYKELESILYENGLLIYEHIDADVMTNTYFKEYNIHNKDNKIIAPRGVCYLLAVKRY